MKSLDRYEEEMCQILWTHLLESKQKSCRHEEESCSSWCRSSKCCLGLWQHSNALLLFTVVPKAPVHSEPQFCNYKQSRLVPDCGLAVIMPVSVSAHTLTFVVLLSSLILNFFFRSSVNTNDSSSIFPIKQKLIIAFKLQGCFSVSFVILWPPGASPLFWHLCPSECNNQPSSQ